MKQPNKVGGGARTNKVGLHFEQTISLRTVFDEHPDFTVKDDKVYQKGKEIGLLCGKADIYKKVLAPRGVNYQDYVSKRLYPDDAILINKTVYIIEKKFQSGAGSVDEKLQTCDFKKKQYSKLFSAARLKVEYIYVLNDWFKQDCYKDVHEYILSVGCKYYFLEIPLACLGLE